MEYIFEKDPLFTTAEDSQVTALVFSRAGDILHYGTHDGRVVALLGLIKRHPTRQVIYEPNDQAPVTALDVLALSGLPSPGIVAGNAMGYVHIVSLTPPAISNADKGVSF